MTDYNTMSKKTLVKKIAKAMGVGVTSIRKESKESLVARAIKLFAAKPTVKVAGSVTPKPAPAQKAKEDGPHQHYRLTSNGGSTFLRRDQPRKPGDVAQYRVVKDPNLAFVVKSTHQLAIKLAEAAELLGTTVKALPFTPAVQ